MLRDMARLTRRGFLVAGAGVVVAAGGLAAGRGRIRDLIRDEPALEKPPKGDFPPPRRIVDCGRPLNPTVAENCRPGSTGWKLARAEGAIEGFFAQTSVERGEDAVLKVRCDDPEYRVEVYRSGYYGDTGGRLVKKAGPRRATAQPDPQRDEETGLVSAAGWSESLRFDTSGWPSGVYLARLIGSGGSDGQALLVVRDRARRADALVIIPDTTYLAYNYWGDYSLYAGDDGSPRAVRVSFDRPYINVTVDQADWYLRCELPLVRWLEAEGYDVTYAAASDLHRGVELGTHRAWVSCGHSEYWSDEMRAAFEGARDRGVGLAFMGANTGYWRVRFEEDPWSKEPDRVMVCYKMTEESPTTLGADRVVDPVSRTTLWRDPDGPDRPENALIGVMYVGQDLTRDYPVVVPADMAADPLWDGADLTRTAGGSTSIGQELVGWEWDSAVDNGRAPKDLRLLSATPVTGDVAAGIPPTTPDTSAVAHCAAYTAPSGALVFATGSMLFSWGLDREGYRLYSGGHPQGEPDLRIQQLFTNVLGEMGCRPGSPAADLEL